MKTKRRFISILLSLALVLGLMTGMGPAVYASTEIYTNLIPSNNDDADALAAKVVQFNNYEWYIIADNSSAVDEGTVTLFAKGAVGVSQFNEDQNDGNAYRSSAVKGFIDALTGEGGSFSIAADAIRTVDLTDVNVTGAKLYLLSTSEAQALPTNIRTYSDFWWLRSAGTNGNNYAASVTRIGDVRDYGTVVTYNNSIRPALQLDLSQVTFHSDTNTFTLNAMPDIAVIGVSLDKTDAQTIDVDESVSFTATVAPEDATDKSVKWSVGGTNADAVTLYSDEACTTPVGTDSADILTVYAKGMSEGTATVTVTATNGTDDTADDKTASCDVTVNPVVPVLDTYIITSENFSQYFKENGYLKDIVAEGSTLDFQGEFIGEQYAITINKRVTVTSTSESVAIFDSSETENSSNVMTFKVIAGAEGTTISNLEFLNCRLDIRGSTNVTVDNITIKVLDKRVGSGIGFLTIAEGASYTVVKNSYIECRNNGGSSCVVIGKGADHVTFENNTAKSYGNVGNMFNATMFNFTGDVTPGYITYKNNTFIKEEGGATANCIMLAGDGNILDGNTMNWSGNAISSGYGTTPTNNIYKNNTITGGGTINVCKLSAAEGNVTDGNVTVSEGAVFTNNTVGGKLTVSGKDAQISENTVNANVTINRAATNTCFTNNTVNGKVDVTANECTITDNIITSTEEYAVVLSKSSTDVEFNTLNASEKKGDNAVDPGSGTDNIIRNNGSELYPLWVGGKQVTEVNASDADGTRGWSFTPAEGDIPATLTLNGYSYEGKGCQETKAAGYWGSILWEDDESELVINLQGENSLCTTGEFEYPDLVAGIFSFGNLCFAGTGCLTVESIGVYGIVGCRGVNVEGGSVTGRSSGYGIYAISGLSIGEDAGTIIGEGTGEGETAGILTYGKMDVQGGSVIASGEGTSGVGVFASSLVIGENVTSVIASGEQSALYRDIPVTNAIIGTGWSDIDGTEGKETIAVSAEGQTLKNYKKVQFPAVHTHDFTVNASENTLTVSCQNDGCTLNPATVTVTINAPTLTVYDGDGSAEATLSQTGMTTEALEAFSPAFAGMTVDQAMQGFASYIAYTGRGNTSYETSTTAPTVPGTYTAILPFTYNNITYTATVDYEIAMAVPTITTTPTAGEITYGQTLADSALTDGVASVEGNFAWKDSTIAPAVADSQTTEYDVIFTPEDENYSTAECKVKLTVNKADSAAATVTANNRTFDGTGQPLVTVDDSMLAGGEMQYALGDDAETAPADGWSADIPNGKDTGTYFVWYMVAGDENHEKTVPEAIEVTISPKHETCPFVDVSEDKYYYEAVMWAINQEPAITTGVDDTHYNPSGLSTRGQVVTFLWRIAGCPEPTIENPFTDVKEGKYYYDAVLWAYENGITTGKTDTTFDPAGKCSRKQFITFLWRMADCPVEEGLENPFVDVPAGEYYTDAVLWAYANEITTGTDETHFSPNDKIKRGQLITFIYRYSYYLDDVMSE